MSPRPGGDVANSSEFAVMGSGEYRGLQHDRTAAGVALRFLREHTAKALILSYLIVTLVARLDDVWFYQKFRINVFLYSEPEDVLLAALRNPITWLCFIAPTLLLLGISWVIGRYRQPGPSASSKWNTPVRRLINACVFTVLVAVAATWIHAGQRAALVKSGTGRIVSFTRNDGVSYGEQPLLIGSSGQFFFLYYAKRQIAEIVPVENTALMTLDLHSKRDPGMAIPSVGSTPRLSP